MTMCTSSCDGVQVIFSLRSLLSKPLESLDHSGSEIRIDLPQPDVPVNFGAFSRLAAEPLRTASIEIHNSAANTMPDIDQSLGC
jgi:hypothetical protein